VTQATNILENPSETPALLASRFEVAAAWASRYLTPSLTAIAVLALCAALVFTIYYTLLDLQWIAFLLGVLFAAVLSLVSQNIKVQWRLVRRTAQLRRSKVLLAEENARSERSAQAHRVADQRYRTILDALPGMIFFVDREERCRYHNLAFGTWCGRNAPDIGGVPLRDLLGGSICEDLKTHGMDASIGDPIEYETQWPHADGTAHFAVKLLPYPVGAQTTSGFYVFALPIATPKARPERSAQEAAALVDPAVAGEAAYLGEMQQQLSAEDDAREYLLRAIEQDRFILLEQRIEALAPQVAEPTFREILLRLTEEDERMVPPGGFFEVAEHYGLMPAIDRWVIRRLLKSCAAMKSADPAWRMPLYCVNLSGATLRDRTFPNHVRAQLRHWDMAGSRLCFEIGHGALTECASDLRLLMEDLKPLGCRFTVDCFGSHRISFAPFERLRFDFIKIDGSIVAEILRQDSELAKARAIVLACSKIGVRTIAQFVEDDATRAKLKAIGVDFVQGFGIDRPGPLAVMPPVVSMAPRV
jgi:EAL domain-containing protein (putative c-di-GMP-specific phosphodiesterase class I)/PAS domain-containing protein